MKLTITVPNSKLNNAKAVLIYWVKFNFAVVKFTVTKKCKNFAFIEIEANNANALDKCLEAIFSEM